MLGFGWMGNEGGCCFSSHPFLSGALPIPHLNKQNIYITVLFFIHPFKPFAATFWKTLLFNIDYAEDPPPKTFLLIIFSETHISLAVGRSQEDTRRGQRPWHSSLNSKHSAQGNALILSRGRLNVILIVSHEYDSILWTLQPLQPSSMWFQVFMEGILLG